MPIATFQASVAVQRSNTRVPRRDFVLSGGDIGVLAVTVYQTQYDTAPMDISAISANIYLFAENYPQFYWDYGLFRLDPVLSLWTISGTPIDPKNGRVDFSLASTPPDIAYRFWSHRFWYALTLSYSIVATTGIGLPNTATSPNYAQGQATIMHGVIDFGISVLPALPQSPELLGNIGRAQP